MKSYKRISALSETFKTEHLDPQDPRISAAVEAYKAQWGLPAAAQPVAEVWFGVFDQAELLLVAGEKRRDKALEITDLYVVPGAGRRATVAVFALLNVYATALRRGLYSSMVATVLFRNKSFAKAVERVFRIEPTALVYMAEAA